MRTELAIDTIDTHTAGEPTRIVTGGLGWSADGRSVRAQRDAFAAERDRLRRLLMMEPRGHDHMYGAVPVEPAAPGADLGAFFMDSERYGDMCGHGTMGLVTALVETGRLDVPSPRTAGPGAPEPGVESGSSVEADSSVEPTKDGSGSGSDESGSERAESESEGDGTGSGRDAEAGRGPSLAVETPAGLVEARPTVEAGRVERVAVTNVPSYVVGRRSVSVEGFGEVTVDVVASGNVFAVVDVREVGLDVTPGDVDALVDASRAIRTALASAEVTDPLTGDPATVTNTEFYRPGAVDRNVVVFGDGSVDRSPCGTGTCAKVTLLHDRGTLDVGESYPYESVIGTRFEGRVRESWTEDGVTVVRPAVAGSAYVVAKNTYLLDPEDPLVGFSLSEGGVDDPDADTET